LLLIDNKISALPAWRYISKPFCSLFICVTRTNNIWCTQNVRLHQQCVIHWQSNSQILFESTDVKNSYSRFCEVTLKSKVSDIKQLRRHVGLTVKL